MGGGGNSIRRVPRRERPPRAVASLFALRRLAARHGECLLPRCAARRGCLECLLPRCAARLEGAIAFASRRGRSVRRGPRRACSPCGALPRDAANASYHDARSGEVASNASCHDARRGEVAGGAAMMLAANASCHDARRGCHEACQEVRCRGL